MSRLDVSIVIPAYNCAGLLDRCLTALEASRDVAWEATVVDNGSPEDLSRVRFLHPGIRWWRLEKNVGYAEANNVGLQDSTGRTVCWLNSDAELEPGTLACLVRYLEEHPDVGAVTPVNLDLDARPLPSCSPEHTLRMAFLRDSGLHLAFPNSRPYRDWLLPGFDYSRTQDVLTTQTTCLLIRRDAYLQVGEMDASMFLFYNDVDYCRRLRRAGWRIVFHAGASVFHHGSASVETAPWKERRLWSDRYRFFDKWYGLSGRLAVRCACIHRGLTRVAAQAVRGRWREIPRIAALSWELYGALSQR